jgi:hypothetical protein
MQCFHLLFQDEDSGKEEQRMATSSELYLVCDLGSIGSWEELEWLGRSL